MKIIVEVIEVKRTNLPKRFLTVKGRPTQNSLNMYFIYLSFLPNGWNLLEINESAVQKVRDYFEWENKTGFDVMIMWGINLDCGRSRTSNGRHHAMALAFHDAKGMIGKGYVFSPIKLNHL